MSQILIKVAEVDPNNSDAVKEALSGFFQNLSKHTEGDCNRWLRALVKVLNRFSKYCMSYRPLIETYLVHFLSSNNYYNVIEAAKCAQALQQVRPSQEKTSTPKSSWRDQMNTLCNAAHTLIGIVFPQAVDIYKNSEKLKKELQPGTSPLSAALSNISIVALNAHRNEQNKQDLLCTRLRNVFVFIQAMLVEIYPVAKPIRPQTILDVIMRALSVSSGTNTSSQSLPDVCMVKTQALRTLDALVACLGSNLIPFSPLIFRFVMQTLKWSTDNPSDESKKVRCIAYKSISQWLDRLRTHRAAPDSGRCWEDELTNHVLADITPARHVVQLTMSAHSTKRLSKKAKRKLANTMLQESTISTHMPGEKNKIATSEEKSDDVAIAALECAESFFTVCGVFLKPATHKSFQERLVRECYNLDNYTQQRALALLRALDSCRRAASPAVPPPTQYCLHVYSMLLNNVDREISRFCSQALLEIRLHLHCSPPSLNFALEVQPEKQKRAEEKKKKISSRNRAALEALLGVDKMPTKSPEDIITIPDEPLSKKPRLEEEISDQISLSSETDNSIEISDDENVLEIDEERNANEEESDPIELDEMDGKEQVDAIDSADTQMPEKPDKTIIEKETEKQDKDRKDIFNDTTQIPLNICNNTTQVPLNIFNDTTQMPPNISADTTDEEERPHSMEVTYDFPNTGKEKVTALEKLDDENLPSTNDTDDIQITCGQVVQSSQEVEKIDSELKIEEPKVNGVGNPIKIVQNGVSEDKEKSVTPKAVNDGLNVEDMLADFVDEVNEDTVEN